VYWTDLAQDMDVMNTAITFQFP